MIGKPKATFYLTICLSILLAVFGYFSMRNQQDIRLIAVYTDPNASCDCGLGVNYCKYTCDPCAGNNCSASIECWAHQGCPDQCPASAAKYCGGYPQCCPVVGPVPTAACNALTCENVCGLGGCPGGCGSQDNCGGVSCSSCPGTTSAPPPPAATPTAVPQCSYNCSCAANTCRGSSCPSGCQGVACIGQKLATQPTAPVQNNPANTSKVPSGTITLRWNTPASWGTCDAAHEIQLCVGASFSDPCIGSISYSGIGGAIVSQSYVQNTPGWYYWKVGADNNGIGTTTSWSPVWSFKVNSPPQVVSLAIKNSVNTIVPVEAANRNQICQTTFLNTANPRKVVFELTLRDPDGWADINSAQIRWNNNTNALTLGPAINATDRLGTVMVDYTGVNSSTVAQIDGIVTDKVAISSGWQNTSRSWKVWNCQVSTSGNIYEIDQGTVCSANIKNLALPSLNFTKVGFTGISPAADVLIGATSDSSYGPGNLLWGQQYITGLPGIDGSPPTGLERTGSGGSAVCQGSLQLTLNQAAVDAYAASPQIKIDFGSVRNQDSWWQALGGGVMAKTQISNRVPITCTGACVSAMINQNLTVGASSDGVTFGQTIANNSGCALNDKCFYSNPRNIYKTGVSGKGENIGYAFLRNKLSAESGVGVIYATNTDLTTVVAGNGGTGVAFVNGNLNIDVDNTVAVGKFFMIVVSGSINISSTVNKVEGVLVSDGGININGTSDTALNINGTVYTNGTVTIGRGYTTTTNNNTQPAVKFNYRPDLLFNLPVTVSKVLSNWRVDQ